MNDRFTENMCSQIKDKSIRGRFMENKISIIMPIYNSAEYLDDSINSVLKQIYKEFELILVDDGSLDNSWDICLRYSALDSRVKCFHIENQGVSAARNYGISKSCGKYIRFMDADDTLPIDSLKLLLQPYKQYKEIDLVIGKYDTNDSNLYLGELEGLYTIKEMVEHYLTYIPSFYYGVTWNKLYRADVIKENNLLFAVSIQWSEDMLFNVQYMKKCSYIYYVNHPIYNYVRRPSSLSMNVTDNNRMLINNIDYLRFENVKDLVQTICGNDWIMLDRVYSYMFKMINIKLCNALRMKNATWNEKYYVFSEIIKEKKIKNLICEYPYKNRYLLYNFMVQMIKKERYRFLFVFYFFKNKIRDNKFVSRYMEEQSWILPKYPL